MEQVGWCLCTEEVEWWLWGYEGGERVVVGLIDTKNSLSHCPSAYNYADILTKPLMPLKVFAMRHMCHDSKVDQMSARGVSDEAQRIGERDKSSKGSILIYI